MHLVPIAINVECNPIASLLGCWKASLYGNRSEADCFCLEALEIDRLTNANSMRIVLLSPLVEILPHSFAIAIPMPNRNLDKPVQ